MRWTIKHANAFLNLSGVVGGELHLRRDQAHPG